MSVQVWRRGEGGGHLTARCYTYILVSFYNSLVTTQLCQKQCYTYIKLLSRISFQTTRRAFFFLTTQYHLFLDYRWLVFACILLAQGLISDNCSNSMEEFNRVYSHRKTLRLHNLWFSGICTTSKLTLQKVIWERLELAGWLEYSIVA